MSLNGITIKRIEDIHPGDKAWFSKTVTEADVMMFAMLVGDYAPHHVNREFGETTIFKSRIAHGMLTSGLICPVLTKLCGDTATTFYQQIKYKSAVLLNDTVTVEATVTEVVPQENHVMIDVVCTKQNTKPEDRPLILAKFIQTLNIEVNP